MKRRPDGRWQKRITLPNGKSKLLYSSAATERLANKDFNEQMLGMQQEKENSFLFKSIGEKWKEEHFPKMQNNTLKQYRPCYASAIEYFGDFKITDIKAFHIKQYINSLQEKGFAQKTVKNRLLVVSLIFKYAILNEYTETDPCVKISIPKNLPKTKRQNATKEDELIICNSTNSPCGILAYLYLTTGCRRGEALALSPEDVNIKERYIKVTKTVEWIGNAPQIKHCPKTDAGIRKIPISQKLAELLSPLMNNNFLFQNDDKELITNCQFTRMWDKYKKETGITCTPHQLRHSYATILFDAGIDVKTAQCWLGHADINTTLGIYTHLSEQKQNEAIKKLNLFLTTF